MKVGAIIPAAGSGTRMGGARKPFLQLAGKPLLQHCLEAFFQIDSVRYIVVALPADESNQRPPWLTDSRVTLVPGGAHRADSVRAGLSALPDDVDVVVVHDAARPLVTPELIMRVLEAVSQRVSATVAVPVTDTLHQVDDNQGILATPPRSRFWRAQTPQAFPRQALELAYARNEDASTATDEAGLVARSGCSVKVVPGEDWNIKITTPEDLVLAEATLRKRGP
jgi:2-C-methyl-D-erythritol 4-phosphate cytidylyltransferase